MRRIKAFGKLLAASYAALCLLSVYCFADTSEDIEAALAGQANAQYNVSLNAPFSKEQSGLHEIVDPETGNMRVSLDLFHYKVRGSLELDLSLTYSLSEARSQKHSFEYRVISCANVNEPFSPVELAQRNIAIGWSYNFPFVQKVGRVRYLNLPGGSTYRVDFDTESGLRDYELSDLVFKSGSFEQAGSLSGAYKLRYIDGIEYLFAENGLLIKKSDRYGNWIEYIWDTSDNSIRLSKICDCTGREILFTYNKFVTQITLEDRSYSFHKQAVSDEDPVGILTKVSDPEGRETYFSYRDDSLEYTLADGIAPISMRYYALSEIAYPTGLHVYYEYLSSRKGASSGYMDYLKLARRFDEMPDGTVCNTQWYSYGGEPDAYPAAELPNQYTYSTTVYSDGNKVAVYAYDHRHLQLYRETSYGGVLAEHVDFEYDQNRFPTKTVTRIYNKQGNYRTVTSEINYDRFGKLLSETTYDVPENRELYRKDYTYGGAYLLPVSTNYKQSADTNIQVKNTLSRDEKSVVSTSVYENGICLKTDLYEYDSYGNRISESIQRSDNECSTRNYIFSAKTGYAYPDSVISLGVTDADGRTRDIAVSSEYDTFGNTLSATDGNGNTTYYTYDKLDRVLTETLPDGTVRRTEYRDADNRITVTDGEGNALIYQYDALGRPVSVCEPTTGILLSQKTYTADGLPETEKDALGTLYAYSYDIFRRLSGLTVSDDSGILTETHYDNDAAYAYGDTLYRRAVTEISDGKTLRRTEQLWDFRDLLMFEILSANEKQRITSYAYDYAGNAVNVISPGGAVIRMDYDAFGNKVRETSGETVNRYGYDLAGNLLYQTNGEGETTTYAYDGFGKVVRMATPYTGAETATVKNYYDNNGNIIRTVSAEGLISETEYDCRNRAVRSVMENAVTAYTYDREGRILTQTQVGQTGGGKTTVYTYDVFGNVKTVTDNLGQTAYYTYDAAGNLLKTIDRNQTVLYNEYDGMGRVVRSYNTRDAGETRYTYNVFGELIRANDGGKITDYCYNGFGELIQEKTDSTVKEYAYNADGNRILFRLSDGEHEEMRTEYAYDEQMRLKSVNTPIGKQIYTYDKANRVVGVLNETTGEETEYLYYPSGAVRNIIIKRGGKEVDRQYYEYDKDGNRTLEMGSGSVKQYTYDEQNRLKRCITDLNYITDYWYDEYNNITVTRTLSGGAAYLVYYEYDENNRLISSNDGHQTTTYAYDANGNMLRSDGEETTDYIFNGAGELAEVWKEGVVYTYEYDHTGLRTAKTVDGVTTSMITDGMYVVAECTDVQNTYYYRGMNLMGYVSDDEIGYYRFNAHGDVVAVVDTAGGIVTEYSYDPFGKLEDDENEWLKILFGIYVEDNNPFRYCAEYYDSETEFIYLRARYYSPDLQRFISEDPIRDGFNWYAYCGNMPIMYADPLGLLQVNESDTEYLSDSELSLLKSYIDEYGVAEANGDYVGMNRIMKNAVALRQRNYRYHDSYDYTHGGRIYTYEYTYSEFVMTNHDGTGHFEKRTAYVYILNLSGLYSDKEKGEELKQAERQSIGMNDYVVIDYRNNSNPNMKIVNSYRADKETRLAVIDVLLKHEANFPTNWSRERSNMEIEWAWHNIPYGLHYQRSSTRDVDLDNAAAGFNPITEMIRRVCK